ncbi:ser/thr protein phosphatase [Scheffersomyces amazonensis]|uniref:ser/thr protein phosphatase n=1 Tax=Scheffersomyces amazonensis TaxID=1078765 RepID=UPI00315D71AD
MGQLLSHPIEDKEIIYQSHETVSYCIGSMQGYRTTMEDAYDVKVNEDETLAVFGVFDGHGGKSCAEYLKVHLVDIIFKQLNIIGKQGTTKLSDYIRITKNAFFKVDSQLSSNKEFNNCGSTGIISALINNQYLVVANTGDSRCILSLGGQPKTLSFDHKPVIMNERVRIENSNGYIKNNRINEILALSRAFGDFKFKLPYIDSPRNEYINKNKQYFKNDLIHLPPELFQVTVEPEVILFDIENASKNPKTKPEFMVIACDGIWDCYKNKDLINTIRHKLSVGWKLNKIIEFILHDCLMMASNYTGIGFDNMTIIIIALHKGTDMDQWYESMKHKVLTEKGLA